jgi:adenylosuccinate synthase
MNSTCICIFGAQYGDEAKGKLVCEIIDGFSKINDTVVCVRFNGGSNAGHSIYKKGVLFDTHVIPSGILESNCINVIGTGVLINPIQFLNELSDIQTKFANTFDSKTLGKIYISDRSHMTLLIHRYIDSIEGKQFGSTGSGISQTMGDKANRRGIQFGSLNTNNWKDQIINIYKHYTDHFPSYFEDFEFNVTSLNQKYTFSNVRDMMNFELQFIVLHLQKLMPYVTNTSAFLNNLDINVPIVFEGANSIMLDSNIGYPNCTATTCTIGGLLSGSDINVKFLNERNFKVIGVTKGYITRVGTGNLITEDFGEDGCTLQQNGQEYGTTTGRARRTGWFDAKLIEYTNTFCGYDYLNLTKLDVMSSFDKVKICVNYIHKTSLITHCSRDFMDIDSTDYTPCYITLDGWKDFDFSKCTCWDDLHPNVQKYIDTIEKIISIPVVYINTGKEHGMTIIKSPASMNNYLEPQRD